MSNCTCGRTTRPPMCDGSHCLTEAQYRERTARLQQLFGKPKQHDRSENTYNPTK
jgi:CDGSH-type Zn-finger protein